MFNLDNITEKADNGWPYRKLIIGPSGSGKTNYLLNSIQRDPSIKHKIYLYAKDLEEPRYKLLINKREKAGINFNNDPNAFIEHSNSVDDIFPQIEDYNNRITKIEPYIINLNWNNINFPPTNQDYASFEINNENISLNIYQLDNEIISQLYKSIHNRPKEINLLLLENKHYACIKNLKSLLN